MSAPRFPRFTLMASLTALLIVAALTSYVPASGTTLCSSPPPVVAEKDLKPGTMGTAWTVIKGTKPVSFQVKVLGTMKGGIAPGIDFILIKVSGSVIDQTGGIAAGMSGSPVYVGGVLAGSVSYGFEGTDPTIGGMTPAVDMEKILGYETPPTARHTVTLGSGLRRAFARASASTTFASAPAVARPLAVPLVVSGGLTRAAPARRLRHWFSQMGTPFVLESGSGDASATGAPKMGPAPAPGDAMAAAVSFGDAYSYAIGTATLTCNDQFVAFGHPFFLTGPTSLALTNAKILQTLSDPSHFSGGTKFGEATTLAGIVTQDRLAGIAGITGVLPPLTAITSNLSDPSLGTSRHGETQVASQSELPYIAYGHVYLNLLTVADEEGPGSANLDVTIQGTDETGEPWTVQTSDLYASSYDIQDEAGYEAALVPLDRLLSQNFEHVTVDNVSIQGTVSGTDLTAEVAQVLSHTGLQPGFGSRNTILARRGGLIHLRVMLRPAGSHTLVPVNLTVHVPNVRHGREMDLFVGGASEMGGGGKISSFAELVHALNHQPKQSEVDAELIGRGIATSTTLSGPTGHVVQGRRVLRVLIAP
jgi:SpoIVB peptidase S55